MDNINNQGLTFEKIRRIWQFSKNIDENLYAERDLPHSRRKKVKKNTQEILKSTENFKEKEIYKKIELILECCDHYLFYKKYIEHIDFGDNEKLAVNIFTDILLECCEINDTLIAEILENYNKDANIIFEILYEKASKIKGQNKVIKALENILNNNSIMEGEKIFLLSRINENTAMKLNNKLEVQNLGGINALKSIDVRPNFISFASSSSSSSSSNNLYNNDEIEQFDILNERIENAKKLDLVENKKIIQDIVNAMKNHNSLIAFGYFVLYHILIDNNKITDEDIAKVGNCNINDFSNNCLKTHNTFITNFYRYQTEEKYQQFSCEHIKTLFSNPEKYMEEIKIRRPYIELFIEYNITSPNIDISKICNIVFDSYGKIQTDIYYNITNTIIKESASIEPKKLNKNTENTIISVFEYLHKSSLTGEGIVKLKSTNKKPLPNLISNIIEINKTEQIIPNESIIELINNLYTHFPDFKKEIDENEKLIIQLEEIDENESLTDELKTSCTTTKENIVIKNDKRMKNIGEYKGETTVGGNTIYTLR